MKNLFMFAIMSITIVACATNDDEAVKALSDNGFNDITITNRGFFGAQFMGCDQKDQNWYHANATNPAGRKVNMLVCCGGLMSFKGCTVRSK